MSKFLLTALAILGLLAGGAAYAAEGVAPAAGGDAKADAKVKPVVGTVVSFADNKLVIKVKGHEGKEATEQTIATNDKTEVVIDGAAKALADLKADMKVKVTMDADVAKKIEVGKAEKKHN